MIAYTYKASWYPGTGPSIGKRDVRFASSTLDSILKKVVIGPEMDADTISYTPKAGTELSQRSLPQGVLALSISLPVVLTASGEPPYTTHFSTHVRVRKIKGQWTAVGTRLPGASGPSKYCNDSSAAGAYCNIFPAGSS